MNVTTLNLVSLFTLSPAQRARIEAVDPRIKLQVAPFGMLPDGTIGQAVSDEELRRQVGEANVIFGSRLPLFVPEAAPDLSWIQFGHAGMELFVERPVWSSDVIITNATGIQAPMIAEWAIAMIHYFAKQMPEINSKQRKHEWGKFSPRFLPISGATVGIIGLGHIGQEVAWRGRALGMRVLGTRRTARTRRVHSDGVAELFPADHLHEMLPECDYVVLSVPLTRKTRGWLDAAAFAAMKPGAFFINVCRGGVVDEASLIEALSTGHLAGAALDVFAAEPLPSDSPLWDMPNVVVSPHQSGSIEGSLNFGIDLLIDNLRRYLAGKPLLNVVDREQGY